MMEERHRGGRAPEAGFTLVEIVVALTVLALLLGAVATTLNVMSLASRRGSKDIDRIDMVARGLAAVRRDLMRMERVVATDKTGTRFVFTGTKQSVSFVAIEPNYPSDPGSYVITYTVRGAGLVRSRDVYDPDQRAKKGPRREEAADVTVLEGPYRFQFSFLEQDANRPKWVDTWTDPRKFPDLIRLDTTATAPNVAALPPIVVRPRVDAEVACAVATAKACSARNGGRLIDAPPTDQRNQPPPQPEGR